MTAGVFSTAAAFVLTVLANSLWQAALLAISAWIVMRAARGASATTRHAILVVALIGSLALPVVSTSVAFVHRSTPTPAVGGTSGGTRALPAMRSSSATIRRTEPVAQSPLIPEPHGGLVPKRPRYTLPTFAVLGLVALWLAGALLFAVRLAISLLYLERLKRDALPLPIAQRTRLERWASVAKGGRDVRLCRSSEIVTPVAVGIFDAMILIPERLLDDLPAEDLDRILLHELAHLRRGDDWLNALERIAEALFFFNPGIRWIIGQLDVEREVACDDWVLKQRSEALPYAQCLVKLVEGVIWPYRPTMAPGVFVTRRSISIRIERLLAKQRDVRLRISLGPLAAVVGVAAAACALAAYVSPSIASGSAETGTAPTTSIWQALPEPSVGAPHATPVRKAVAATVAQATEAPTSTPSPTPTTQGSTSAALKGIAGPGAAALHTQAQTMSAVHTRASTQTGAVVTTQVIAPVTSARDAAAAQSAAQSATPSPTTTGGDYIAELAGAGYTNLSVDEIIRLKSLGVTAAYIREMQAAGFAHPSVSELIQMRGMRLTPQFVQDMRKVFPSASIQDLASLRGVGVTPGYVSELRDAGLGQISVDSARRMRAVGVDATYVRQLAAAGYGSLTTDQLIQARAVGIDAAFLKSVQAHGFHGPSFDELVRLKVTGVLQ
jgi:beta-lactamase regulating signal transducer with metallopeptidase domain